MSRVVLRDAWTTIVPDRNGRHGPLPPILLVKTMVTGLVDSFSYLALGHVFVANMTGNVVFSGFAIAGAAGFSLGASLAALASFAAGSVLCGRIIHRTPRDRGRVLSTTLTVQTALVIAAFATAQASSGSNTGSLRYSLIVLLGLAMGVQNASARFLAVPDLTTTVLTQTVAGIAADGRLAGGSDSKAGRRLLSVALMFLGALAGAAAIQHGHRTLPLLIGAILLTGATIAAFAVSRKGGPWTEPVAGPAPKPAAPPAAPGA
jgi:uncharacterized membrane protein YoaK (UPF0700 family)